MGDYENIEPIVNTDAPEYIFPDSSHPATSNEGIYFTEPTVKTTIHIPKKPYVKKKKTEYVDNVFEANDDKSEYVLPDLPNQKTANEGIYFTDTSGTSSIVSTNKRRVKRKTPKHNSNDPNEIDNELDYVIPNFKKSSSFS